MVGTKPFKTIPIHEEQLSSINVYSPLLLFCCCCVVFDQISPIFDFVSVPLWHGIGQWLAMVGTKPAKTIPIHKGEGNNHQRQLPSDSSIWARPLGTWWSKSAWAESTMRCSSRMPNRSMLVMRVTQPSLPMSVWQLQTTFLEHWRHSSSPQANWWLYWIPGEFSNQFGYNLVIIKKMTFKLLV